jgi:cyanate lyase
MPNLEVLITSVREEAADGDPLAQLTKASEYAGGLAKLGDLLLDHFVNECRKAGLSWAELSSALGVSKQAAHKRFTGSGPMFQRFTDRARKIIVNAEEQARGLGHANVEPEHVLLALAQAQEGLATQALAQLGVTYDQLLEKVVEHTPRNADAALPSKIPFSGRSKNLLQATLEEALGLGHNYIGTEHMVLALHRDEASSAARFLTDLGADSEALHRTVEELLTDCQRKKQQQG